MEIIVALLTMKMNCRLISYINMKRILTFMCIILRLFGAPIHKITQEKNVFTHITFKITEGNHNYYNTKLLSVRNGFLRNSSLVMMRGVLLCTTAGTLMDGQRLTIIHPLIKHNSVRMYLTVRDIIVRFGTLKRKSDKCQATGL